MNNFNIEQIDNLPSKLEKALQQGHINDEAKSGIVCNYKKFTLLLRDQHHEVVGVLSAYTAFAEVYIDDLWVKPNYRTKGLGRRLLQDLEKRFEDKGYNNINLVTSGFQAPAFYKKCGFQEEFIRKNIQNPKLTKSFFVKYFKNKTQTQGLLKAKETES